MFAFDPIGDFCGQFTLFIFAIVAVVLLKSVVKGLQEQNKATLDSKAQQQPAPSPPAVFVPDALTRVHKK